MKTNREDLPVFHIEMNRPSERTREAAQIARSEADRPAAPSGLKLTPAQESAINTTGGSLFVSAAAGSGKTAVLTRRIIEKIRRGGDVRRLLVVTFTVSAAGEMRTRIREGLQKALAENPLSRHLQSQSILTGRARICTIDSFCTDLVRSNFHRLGLAPDFRIADGAESELLRRSALSEVFEEFYARGDEDFLLGVAQFSSQKNDEGYFQTVLSILDWLDSLPYPLEYFRRFAEQWDPQSGGDLYATPWFAEAVRHARHVLRNAVARYAKIASIFAQDAHLYDTYGDVFEAEGTAFSKLLDLIEAEDWSGFTERIRRGVFGSLRGRSLKGASTATARRKEWIFQLREQCKANFAKLHPGIFWGTNEDYEKDLRDFYPILRGLVRVLEEFYERDRQRKNAGNILTFADISQYALRLLVKSYDRQSGKMVRTELARELSGQIDEIYVDEFQDTNLLQNLIFDAVSRNCENLFCVGDVKQAIYRFRRAMPELFLGRMESARPIGQGFPAAIHLSENFRSAEGVLTFANSFFERLMRKEICGMDYDADQRLNRGASYPENDYTPELHLIELYGSSRSADEDAEDAPNLADAAADERKATAQARLCARRIRELMEQGRTVYDRDAKCERSMRYSDVAILMRSTKDRAGTYIRVLQQAGIPCWSETTASYFDNYEVQFTMAFLEAIDNPWSDLSLTAALRSPFFGFTAQQLASLRAANRKGGMYDSLKQAAQAGDEQAANAVRTIARYRELAMNQPVYRLVWQIYMDFSLFAVVSGMEQGQRRQENLRQIYRYARQYENSSLKGLYGFLRYMERAREETERLEAVSPAPAGEYVRICTIHKSKGLEYPIVFLCGADVRFNTSDFTGRFLLHDRLGAGARLRDLDKKLEYTTLARDAIELALRRETIAEELRVLYVAMTRAREKLIVTACIREDKPGTTLRRIGVAQLAADPYMEATQAGSALEWMLGALLRHEASRPLRAEYDIPEPNGEYDDYPLKFARWDEASLADAGAQGAPAARSAEAGGTAGAGRADMDEIRRRMAYAYPYAALARVPAKVSVSDLKGLRMQDEDGKPLYEKKYLDARPAFIDAGSGLTPQQAGTALHKFMQFYDYDGDEPERQLEALTQSGRIEKDEAAAVDCGAVRRFLESPLGVRVRGARQRFREYRFTSSLPAKQYRPDLEEPAASATVLLQGVADLFFEENGKIVIVDYKTDRSTDPAYFSDRYKLQMELYSSAISRITGKEVSERIIYAFHIGREIRV